MDCLKYSCVLVPLSLLPIKSWGASFGGVSQSNLEGSATVCMSIGVRASISGFDDFELSTTDIDGTAGAIYRGSDSFHLESNAPVRVLIDGEPLSNGSDTIESLYSIDGSYNSFDTAAKGDHNGDHVFSAAAQLGRISSQLSGDYSSDVVLTVVPQIGEGGGCGEFSQSFASNDGWVTLAYEDLYPSVGDGDYNDMVVRYHVEESYNAQQELTTVKLQFDALARGAGYNHSFNLSLDGEIDKSRNATAITPEAFVGGAQVRVTYDSDNGSSIVKNTTSSDRDISIFNNTRSVLSGFANVYANEDWTTARYRTTVEIDIASPELNLYSDRGTDSLLWFRPFLTVMNTKQDIDLYEINQQDGMIDDNGNPFGLLVPDTWEWPLERVNINEAYPYFGEYSRWLAGEEALLSDKAATWYDYPASAGLVFNLDRK